MRMPWRDDNEQEINQSKIDFNEGGLLDDQQRCRIQHEIKVYIEQYFKNQIGKGFDNLRILISEDMLIIRGHGFLTETEKFIVKTPQGRKVLRAARFEIARQRIHDNNPYFEGLFGAKIIYNTYDIDPEQEILTHLFIFDHKLAE